MRQQFKKNFRVLIALGLLAISIGLTIEFGWQQALLTYIFPIAILVNHFRLSTSKMAYRKLKKGEIAEAKELVEAVPAAQLLTNERRAMYHFVKGVIQYNKHRFSKARKNLKKSLTFGLDNRKDKSIAYRMLAAIARRKGETSRAMVNIANAQSTSVEDKSIQRWIDELEKEIATEMVEKASV